MKPRAWILEPGRRFRNSAGQVREVLAVDGESVLYLVVKAAKNGAKVGARGVLARREFIRWAWQEVEP